MTIPAGAVTDAPAADASGGVRLRPVRQASGWDLLAGLIALFVPIFGTAFAMAASGTTNTTPLAVAAAVTALLVVVLTTRFSRTGLVLHPDGFTEHGLVTRARFVPSGRVESGSLVQLYDSQRLHTVRHLFLLDPAGRTVLRLRGTHWSDEQIRQVTQHIGVPMETVSEPLTLAELRDGRRTQLHWFERHPLVQLGALTVGGLVAAYGITAVVSAALPPLSH